MRQSTSFYLTVSFIFAAVNYRLVWNYDRGDRRRGDDTRRLHGMAPPLRDVGPASNRGLDSVDDDLDQHDDGSLVMHDYLDDYSLSDKESTEDDTFRLHASAPEILQDDDMQQQFELATDMDKLLYGDDTYNANDHDQDLLTFYLRKREAGFKAMVTGSQNSQDNSDEELSNIAEMEQDADDDGAQDDQMTSQDDTVGEEEEKKDTIWDHRPHQNRTGIPWKGWPDDARGSDSNWWRQSRQCFEVDHICHKRSNNKWFYYQPQSSDNPKQPPLFQPSMELRCEPLRYDRGLIANEQINITVDASSKIDDVTFIDDHTFRFSTPTNGQDNQCKISSVPIHMTLQSMFNFMIGEFYARTLLPLHRLMTSAAPHADGHESPRPWQQDIQFYVHLSHGDQTLYDGHKLLLSGMLSNEHSAEVKAMADLFRTDNSDEKAKDDCECYEKMVFCGYAVQDEGSVGEDDQSDREQRNSEENTHDLTPATNTQYTLWGSSNTADDLDSSGHCGKSEIALDLYSCDEWAELRYFLSSNYFNHYPSLKQDVIRFRRDNLLKLNLIDDSYTGDTKEWKIVGLAQRSYRRSWINLLEIADECNDMYSANNDKKVACIEVNVEKTASPYEQLLLHQSVNALIGVHGAQMTQAVLLPPHSHVLELLPWVPDYIRGLWVQTRHTPTPLGIIFHNTDLYHIGYSLGRDSVPMCEDVGEVGSEEEKECFITKKNRMSFIWENRDFTVKSDVILQYIEHFILASSKECNEMTSALDGGFVKYNIWCQTDDGAADDKTSLLDPKLVLRHQYDYNSMKAKAKKEKEGK